MPLINVASDNSIRHHYLALEQDVNESITSTEREKHLPHPKWPHKPQPFHFISQWQLTIDLLLLPLPVLFLALACEAIVLNGKPRSHTGTLVERAMLLGPTIYPLVFAAIGGRLLRAIALWKAERGTTLGASLPSLALEHLLGSQSLVNSISSIIAFRSINLISIALLALWSLSPLGGQGSLRIMRELNSTTTQDIPVFYADTNMESLLLYSDRGAVAPLLQTIFEASLATSKTAETSPVDLWNHPRIPRVGEVEQAYGFSNNKSLSWVDVKVEDDLTYSSWTGVNVQGWSRGRTTNFSIPYAYLYVDCVLSRVSDLNSTAAYIKTQPWGPSFLKNVTTYDNLLKAYIVMAGEALSYTGTYFITSTSMWGRSGPKSVTSDSIIYVTRDGSKNNTAPNYALFTCKLNTIQVEANIVCESSACRTTRVRRMKSVPPSYGTQTSFNGLLSPDTYSVSNLVAYLPNPPSSSRYNQACPVDGYLYGDPPFSATKPADRDWQSIPISQLSQRMTTALNTYWISSFWPYMVMRTGSMNINTLNPSSGITSATYGLNQTTATSSYNTTIYQVNITWVTILIISATVLLLANIASIVLVLLTGVPDIFGYVSSFTRWTICPEVLRSASFLDGPERMRLLSKVKVQLGDVFVDDEFGYIALKTVTSDQDLGVEKVQKGRFYL